VVAPETPESKALSDQIALLSEDGVSVQTYPEVPRLAIDRTSASGANDDLSLTLAGAPGIYTVSRSVNLTDWTDSGKLTNVLGRATFTEPRVGELAHLFYRTIEAVPATPGSP
jgi:hypothetical protein